MAKAGIDDHFAAGSLTVASLRKMRQRYEPVDVGSERLKRDERLGLALEDASADERARLLNGVPSSVRWAWWLGGERRYRSVVVRLRGEPPAR